MFSYLFMIVQNREDVFVSFISTEKDSGTVLFLEVIMFCSTLFPSSLSSRAYCKQVSILHIFSEMLFTAYFSI